MLKPPPLKRVKEQKTSALDISKMPPPFQRELKVDRRADKNKKIGK